MHKTITRLVHLDGNARRARLPAVLGLIGAQSLEETLHVDLADLLWAGTLVEVAVHNVRVLIRLLVAVLLEIVVVCNEIGISSQL